MESAHITEGDAPIRGSNPLYRLVQPADIATVIAALVVGILFDIAFRQDDIGVAFAIAMLSAPIALLALRRVKNRFAQALVASGVIFASLLVIHDDEILLALNIIAVVGTLTLGAMMSREAQQFRIAFLDTVVKTIALIMQAVSAIPFLLRPILPNKSSNGHVKSIAFGILLAIPILFVLGALLASADSVFASLFAFDATNIGHIFIVLFMAWLFGTAIYLASVKYNELLRIPRVLGTTESITALGLIATLYVIFVISQIVVWVGGAKVVMETAGLTYAEHARQGFFQLIAVGILTVFIVMGLGALRQTSTDRMNKIWRMIALFTVALTFLIVMIAISRLSLYENAYGLTMARFYATLIALALGVVFVLLAISIFRREDGGSWFISSVVATALVFLLVANVAQPQRIVANRNLDRIGNTTVPLDIPYLGFMDGDGVSAVLDRLNELDSRQQREFLEDACRGRLIESKSNNLLTHNMVRSPTSKRLVRECDRQNLLERR